MDLPMRFRVYINATPVRAPRCRRRPRFLVLQGGRGITEGMTVPKKSPSTDPPKKRGPKPKDPAGEPRQKTSFTLPSSAHTKLRLWAAARGIEMTDIIEEAVLEKLDRDKERIKQDISASLSAKD